MTLSLQSKWHNRLQVLAIKTSKIFLIRRKKILLIDKKTPWNCSNTNTENSRRQYNKQKNCHTKFVFSLRQCIYWIHAKCSIVLNKDFIYLISVIRHQTVIISRCQVIIFSFRNSSNSAWNCISIKHRSQQLVGKFMQYRGSTFIMNLNALILTNNTYQFQTANTRKY